VPNCFIHFLGLAWGTYTSPPRGPTISLAPLCRSSNGSYVPVGDTPEFVRLTGLALADALDFRRMQGVELVLVLGPLGVDAPGPFEPQGGDLLHAVGKLRQTAFQVTHDPAQDRPLALEHSAQAPVLFGVGVATGPPLEAAAFLLEGLAQHHARPFGDQHQLAPGDVEQTAVDGEARPSAGSADAGDLPGS